MNDTISTIEKLIREHKEVRATVKTCEETVSDFEQQKKLDDARESLVPGRLEDHKKRAAQLEHELTNIDNALKQHFVCEEESLLDAFESHKLAKLASALSKLITEHERILKALADLRKQVAELAGDKLSISLWHEKAWRLRQGIYNVRQLINEHSGKEELLFRDAMKAIQEQGS